MTAEARWIASTSASALYWAECRLTHPRRVPHMPDEVTAVADALLRELQSQAIEPLFFFAHALPLCVRLESPRQLVDAALAKLHGSAGAAQPEPIARNIATLYAAVQQHLPRLVEELDLRTGPIREQWEARGPGLVAMLRRLTEPDVAPQNAEVILVRPVTGGRGQAFPAYHSLVVEAVLANSIPELPEIVRLAWLWGQLHFDLPKYRDPLGPGQIAGVGRLALIPAVLAAAAETDLARFEPRTIALALDAWQVGPANVELLNDWWITYQESRTPWAVALAGLERLLASD